MIPSWALIGWTAAGLTAAYGAWVAACLLWHATTRHLARPARPPAAPGQHPVPGRTTIPAGQPPVRRAPAPASRARYHYRAPADEDFGTCLRTFHLHERGIVVLDHRRQRRYHFPLAGDDIFARLEREMRQP